ncbi:transcriptional repressor [Candidatus Woesearchaeota archaeon]|nr:transcriptional repressor [Candidatus Woesearchaeota archaeon]
MERITQQRQIVLNLFKKNRQSHLSVYDIYKLAKKKLPKINLSTVYRTVNTLVEECKLNKYQLNEEHYHYQITEHTPHYHMICSECSKIIEIPLKEIEEPAGLLAQKHDFKIAKINLEISGKCRKHSK